MPTGSGSRGWLSAGVWASVACSLGCWWSFWRIVAKKAKAEVPRKLKPLLEFVCTRREIRLVELYARGLMGEADLIKDLVDVEGWSAVDAEAFRRVVVEARWGTTA